MRNATYGLALTLMIGWLIWIGKPVLIPVIAAAISVYVLSTAAESMASRFRGIVGPWGELRRIPARFSPGSPRSHRAMLLSSAPRTGVVP